MSKELFLAKKRLTEWGNWCDFIVTQGLGYSSESIVSRMSRGGITKIAGQAKLLIPTNERAEEIDELIELLAVNGPGEEGKRSTAEVIRVHYTMREKEPNEKVNFLKMNRRTYYRRLQEGQNWIAKHLS